MNKRLLIESLIVAIIIIVIGIGWKVSEGFNLTKEYVPGIINNYESVTVLDSRIAFGIQSDTSLLYYILLLILLASVYYGIRILFAKLRKVLA